MAPPSPNILFNDGKYTKIADISADSTLEDRTLINMDIHMYLLILRHTANTDDRGDMCMRIKHLQEFLRNPEGHGRCLVCLRLIRRSLSGNADPPVTMQ